MSEITNTMTAKEKQKWMTAIARTVSAAQDWVEIALPTLGAVSSVQKLPRKSGTGFISVELFARNGKKDIKKHPGNKFEASKCCESAR